MEDVLVPIIVIPSIFLGLPWIIFHYITKWKQAAKITPQDEHLLDEMYTLARRLEDRVITVERIVAVDHPEFRATLTSTSRDWRDQSVASSYQIDRRN